MNHIVQQMDQHHTPISIFLDMSKAFDTLNHEILLRKLAYYGVKGSANKLLQSYLSERLQYVEFERQISDKLPITTGVPQGSILGPLLFLIYINDLPSVSNFFKMIMYADDTTLYCNINETTTEGIINTELSHVNVWLKANKLSLNVAKTKFMVFHTPNKIVKYPKLKINDHVIERVQSFNFLGLLHYNMAWSKHIEKVSLKISRTIGILNRLKLIYLQCILLTLYNTLIMPHLNYSLLTWGSSIKENIHYIYYRRKLYV